MISGFQALRQARAPMAGLEPATNGSLQISGRIHYHCTTNYKEEDYMYKKKKRNSSVWRRNARTCTSPKSAPIGLGLRGVTRTRAGRSVKVLGQALLTEAQLKVSPPPHLPF
ncbi:hypothetical protein PoB_000556200 [Plakobranchus ocellatus]|uniref:Uncharacterized protein n=1 Tax=Plakobranchus ocellatus TaxID=259542 RepID=A0AAV3YAC2_9GAST|nr:hypothetical protein PoB_000556200 [Plakobranchus ocellatus]